MKGQRYKRTITVAMTEAVKQQAKTRIEIKEKSGVSDLKEEKKRLVLRFPLETLFFVGS